MQCSKTDIYVLMLNSGYLTGLLISLIGHMLHHVKNSEAFNQNLNAINLQETDMVVSFDVV